MALLRTDHYCFKTFLFSFLLLLLLTFANVSKQVSASSEVEEGSAAAGSDSPEPTEVASESEVAADSNQQDVTETGDTVNTASSVASDKHVGEVQGDTNSVISSNEVKAKDTSGAELTGSSEGDEEDEVSASNQESLTESKEPKDVESTNASEKQVEKAGPDSVGKDAQTVEGGDSDRNGGTPAQPTDDPEDGHQFVVRAGVDLSVHDMPVFTEFQKEFYENDTKINGAPTKVYEPEPVAQQVIAPSSSPTRLRNYAAHECGAKVINSNKEAQHPQFVINENKDEYVMQPCSARKWLVIELCEPVVVRKIDIANLELFSSTFENFTVYISKANSGGKERPGKDWHSIGTFHAKEERGVQGFPVNQLDHYTAFVKIEINSYYGNEHFCPITLIRIYGRNVDDDDDDDDVAPEVTSDVKQEEEVPCTEPPPTLVNVTNSTTNTSDQRFVFPPQPAECFLCYDSLSSVPDYCWPEYFDLHKVNMTNATNSTAKDQPTASTEPSKSQSDTSEPCSADSAPKPTATHSIESVRPTEVRVSSTSSSEVIEAKDSPPYTDTAESTRSQPTVQPSPVATDAGSNIVHSTDTAALPAVQSTQTTSQEPDRRDGNEVQPVQPSDVEHILPSPPTLAEPPTLAPEAMEAVPQSTTDSVAEEYSNADVDGEVGDSEDSSDSPPPAFRHGGRSSTISKLSNQVKTLELSLQVTNRYLEEMSKKSKNQKDDLQRALNNTMRSLQNTTHKLELMTKNYTLLKEQTHRLSEQLAVLQEHVYQKETIDWLTPLISMGTLLLAIFISSCLTHRNEGINREEVERILEDLPDSPMRRGHKRSGSDSEIISSNAQEKQRVDSSMKKAKSYATFNSVSAATAPGSVEPIGVFEQKRGGATHVLSAGLDGDGHLSKPLSQLSQDVQQQDIEIISPTTWRTYNTPNGKTDKPKKKRRSGKTKSSKTNRQDSPIIPEAGVDQSFTNHSDGMYAAGSAIDHSNCNGASSMNEGDLGASPFAGNSSTDQPVRRASFFSIFRRSSEL